MPAIGHAFVACCLLLALQATAHGAGFPKLEPATRFTGETATKYGQCQVELSLLDGNYFVLRQIFTSSTRRFVRDLTGTWRQRKEGAVLLLNNRFGLSLPLNVGASHNLYGSVPSLGSGHKIAITLHESRFVKPVFTMMGTVLRTAKGLGISDAATGRFFHLTGSALQNLPRADQLFVDVELAYGLQTCELLKIRSFSLDFPKQQESLPRLAFSSVQGKVFWLTLPNGQKLSCSFEISGDDFGQMEIAGRGLWLAVPLTFRAESLQFSLQKKDAQMLTLLDLAWLRRLLESTQAWAKDGTALLFLGAEGELALLEEADAGDMGQKRRF